MFRTTGLLTKGTLRGYALRYASGCVSEGCCVAGVKHAPCHEFLIPKSWKDPYACAYMRKAQEDNRVGRKP